jgi:mono/diheme cytochrome c family protein
LREPARSPALNSLAVRRLALFAVLALLLAGCSDTVPGGKKVVTPTPDTVVGKLPKPTKAPVGNPTAGKQVFVANGCGACHVFTPAATTGKVGPDLDNLAAYAKTANQGTLSHFVSTSVTSPGAYVAPGFPNGMPPTYATSLSSQQLADLVAFLVKGP